MKDNNDNEKKSIKITSSYKTPVIVGAIGATTAVVGGVIGYHLAKSKLKKEHKQSLSDYIIPKNLLPVIIELHKNSDVRFKFVEIDKKINSNNWIDIHGAILTSFSELECTLSKLFALKIPEIKAKDNYHKKIGQLNHHNVISTAEHDELKQLGEIRNNLVHGKYKDVHMDDIKAAYRIINNFIQKYHCI